MRRALPWLAAWVALTAVGTLLHHSLWSPGGGLDSQTAAPSLVRGVGNLLHVLIGPAWVVLRVVTREWSTGEWLGPLLANALSWVAWLTALRMALAVRRWALASPRDRGPMRMLGPVDSSRRRFLVDGSWALAAAGGGVALVDGVFVEPWRLEVRSYRIPIPELPAGLDGLRLVQISDTHLGPRIPASFLRAAFERAMALAPDVYVLTGDYVHNGPAFIGPAAALFKPLVTTGRPVIAVLGNHDWYADGRAMDRAMDAVGVHMIDNRRVWLDAGTRGLRPDLPREEAVCIAGVGDLKTHYVDMAAALAGLPDAMPRLLLAHNPDTAEFAVAGSRHARTSRRVRTLAGDGMRVDLMLSGHTHGGQVRVPLLGTPAVPSWFGQKYAGGLVHGPRFPVLVSRGVGMSLLPVRLGVPPELVEITLVRA